MAIHRYTGSTPPAVPRIGSVLVAADPWPGWAMSPRLAWEDVDGYVPGGSEYYVGERDLDGAQHHVWRIGSGRMHVAQRVTPPGQRRRRGKRS